MKTGAKQRSGKWSTIRIVLVGFAVLIVLYFLVAVGFALFVGPGVFLQAKKAKLQNEFNMVQTAELNYYTEYTIYPVAADNAALIHMLDGSKDAGNTRQIAFLSYKQSDLDAKGELLDPWGTPIEMSVTDEGKFHWRSAGPDKLFGTADDITSDYDPVDAK